MSLFILWENHYFKEHCLFINIYNFKINIILFLVTEVYWLFIRFVVSTFYYIITIVSIKVILLK